MEEFRSIIAETLTLSLFNLKILQRIDFIIETHDSREIFASENSEQPDVSKDSIGLISGDETETELLDLPEQRMGNETPLSGRQTGKYPVKLRPNSFKKVIDAFEKKLTTAFFYPPAGRRLTYSDAIIYQASHFRKVIEGEANVYIPVMLK
jgi:CRISPR-associated protein Cas1